MSKISFVIPVHNASEYIEKCVDSILNQTFDDYEILLVEDNSTDDSWEKCESIKNKSEKIKLFKTYKPYGVSVARNIGIENADGEWVSFVDSDDWLKEDFVETFLNIKKSEMYDIIACDYICALPDSEEECQFLSISEGEISANIKKNVMKEMIVPGILSKDSPHTQIGVPWSKIYKLKFLKDKKLTFVPGLKKMQDSVFNLSAFEKSDKVFYIHKSLYYYRKNINSVCNRYNGFNFDVSDQLLHEIKSFIDSYYSKDEEWNMLFYRKAFDCYLETVNLLYAHIETEYTVVKSVAELKNKRWESPYLEITDNIKTNNLPFKKKILFVLFSGGNKFTIANMFMIQYVYYRIKYLKLWKSKRKK